MLILPGTDTASANKTLEKLRLVVANHEWLLRQLTVSIGLASADLFDDKKQLLEVADQMLYKAKTQGRNQTSVFATLLEICSCCVDLKTSKTEVLLRSISWSDIGIIYSFQIHG